ncbi:alpha/beta-hydrolase [Thelephora terrestris]|uniref:Alpha/beta-hydrolase n=1 Tax=Thelephora terrestris TaxID=56493 RepID=A0A9P6L595_9AGAM|nr:alpha/beta-hydrolase [Thelephora terrestris]
MGLELEPTLDPITLVYKTISTPNPDTDGKPLEIPLHLDVYPPNSRSGGTSGSGENRTEVPAVVYFHGGGLVVGNRKSWFPEWLHGRLSRRGVAFISADYRLLSPSTGHDILEDIQDLFAYIRNDLNSALAEAGGDHGLRISVDAIAVAGSSAGGLCAYLSAMHVFPKPRALLSVYGQAGECLNDNFLEPKTIPWIPGRDLVDPSDFTDFIYPQSMSLPINTGSPLEYYPPTHPTPGLPATKRMYLTRLYYQLGQWLDYYTGDRTLSERLRQLRSSSSSGKDSTSTIDPTKAREVIGEENVGLFPQFGVTENWPPALVIHGSEDAQVQLDESKHLVEKLKAVGVESKLIVVDGHGHTFDYAPSAERKFGRLFDRATEFLVQSLQK